MPLPWWKFDNEAFLLETRALTPGEVGAYMRLRAEQWARGALPGDPALLRRLAGFPPGRSWAAAWLAIAPLFPLGSDGARRHAGSAVLLDGAAAYSAAQSENGRKGAKSRSPSQATAEPSIQPSPLPPPTDVETVEEDLHTPARDPAGGDRGHGDGIGPDQVLRLGLVRRLWEELVRTPPGDSFFLGKVREAILSQHATRGRATEEATARAALAEYRALIDEWKAKNVDAPATPKHFARDETQARIADRLDGKRPQQQAAQPATASPRSSATAQETKAWFREQEEARARSGQVSEDEARSHIAQLRVAAARGQSGGGPGNA